LRITGGVFDATSIQVSATFSLAGGTIKNATVLPGLGGQGVTVTADSTLDGVTMDANVALTSYTDSNHSWLRIENGLTLNGVLTMTRSYSPSYYYSTILEVAGNQSIVGSGTIQFAQQGARYNNTVSNYIYSKSAGETLTIDVPIQGQSGYVGRGDAALINKKTIDASVAGHTITVRGSSITNQGTLAAAAGVLDVDALQGSGLTNQGTLAVTAGILDVDGMRGNVGAASVSGSGTLDLDSLTGVFTIDQPLAVTGGALTLRGRYSNATTLTLNTGALSLYGDWVNLGVIDSTASTLHLHDAFTLADLGTYNRIGSANRANILGVLENAGATLTLDVGTDWTLAAGSTGAWSAATARCESSATARWTG
jgi:hypothetical protein